MNTNTNTNVNTKTFDTTKAFGAPDISGVLLSGGLDSTVAFHIAMERAFDADENEVKEVIGISIDYGQLHTKELLFAERLCKVHSAKHHVIDIKDIMPTTTLTDKDSEIPDVSYSELSGVSPTYVPYRNGLMLSIAATTLVGCLEALSTRNLDQDKDPNVVGHLYAGMHADDAAGFAYPDCTLEFIGSQANAIWMGTYGKVRLITPLINDNKKEIVSKGAELHVDFDHTWSCYRGGLYHCGTCPTCRSRKQAFVESGIVDPTVYVA